jgi:hypothetical protein
MTGYNITRSAEELLDKYEFDPPSFSIHLHPEYWTLNNGPKFLYNNPVASLLDDVRAHRIPVDYLELFDSAHVPFYDGTSYQREQYCPDNSSSCHQVACWLNFLTIAQREQRTHH